MHNTCVVTLPTDIPVETVMHLTDYYATVTSTENRKTRAIERARLA